MIAPHRLNWAAGIVGLMVVAGCRQDAPPEGARSEPSPYVDRQGVSDGMKPNAAAASPVTVSDVASNSGPAQAPKPHTPNVKPPPPPEHSQQSIGRDWQWPDPDEIGLTVRKEAKQEAFASPLSPMPRASISVDPPTRLGGDELSRRLGQLARAYPSDLRAQLNEQLLKFLRDEPVPDSKLLTGLPSGDRELLSALMDALSDFRNELGADANMLRSRKIRPLVGLSERLRGQAELSVPTVALCTEVKGYGRYTPIDPARFTAGAPHKAVLYYEVENFLSRLNDQKLYETRLAQDVVLYDDSSGLEVWRAPKTLCVDASRARRHDFFIRCLIALPPNLSTGRYLLKVTVEDQQAKHVAENTLPVEFVTQ